MAVSSPSHSPERRLATRFDASALGGSEFAGVEVRGGKFEASMLRGSDFSHADLTAIRTVAFDGARMDKLTYAGLKGMGADLTHVTVA